MYRWTCLLLLLVSSFLGCSDSETTAEDPGRMVCEQDCASIAGAMCSMAQSTNECVDNCLTSYAKCPDEISAFVSCGPQYSCDMDGNPFPMGCDAEQDAFGQCFNN